MAIGAVSLSSAARQNLLALQNTSKLLGTTQSHLSTGKKVNSALDGAASFFASQGFLNSASDLSSLKDNMATALQTIKAASDAISSLSTMVSQLQGIVNSALQSTSATTRASYASEYNALLSQLDSLANDATFNGTNLVNSLGSELKINFNADNTTNLTISGSNLKSTGMGLGNAQNAFAADTLAIDKKNVATVTSLDVSATAAYSGTLDLDGRVTGALATSGVGAEITSSATDFNTGGAMTSGALAKIASTELVSSNTAGNLYAQLVGIAGVTASGDVMSNAASSDLSLVSIHGQFTATGVGGGTAALDILTNNRITVAANGDVTLTIAVGETVQVDYTQATTAKHSVYTNNSGGDITITLAKTGTADYVQVGASGAANSTLTYNLTGGTSIDYTGLELATGNTIGGAAIVDAAGVGLGDSVTVYATEDGTGQTVGTTVTAGVNAYDMSAATLSGLAWTNVKATRSGTASVSYASVANANVTYDNAVQLRGTETKVVKDSLNTAQDQLTRALSTLRAVGSSLGNNNTLVQTRQDFTTNMITNLQTASDNLILADTNEEGANMQALQAQSQLGIVALSISGQQAQAILKLF